MTTERSFIEELMDDLGNPEPQALPAAPAQAAETFPCESCGGTGIYRGVRIHQQASECFACKGRGWFKRSHADRLQARAKAAQRKASKKELAQGTFREANPGLIERLETLSSWNSFATSMLQAFDQWHSLTERQVEACQGMFAKLDAKQAEKAKVRHENSGEVDVSAIEAMFDKARESGLRKLAFVAGPLRIKPAKAWSANAGALYVTRGADDYQGKVMGGRFLPARGVQPDTLAILQEIARNPSEAARDYGRRTGTCCCCGRELTDPVSIAAGIGPICASNWGL